MGLTGNIRVSTNFVNTKDNVDLSTPSENINQTLRKNISSGKTYHDNISLSANQVSILDVGDSSLSDVYGQTITLTGITSLYVTAPTTNTSDITLSGGLSAFLNDMPPIGAGENISFLCDIDVSSNSKLYIVNGATSGSVDVVITGTE